MRFDARLRDPHMLHQLVIRNFAIIDDLTVVFGPGLNVLTGQTGAGKSILIDALGMVLGGRADADAVRTGALRATIDAEFHLDETTSARIGALIEEHGIESGETLLLTREIQSGGRSGARINGRPVTVGLLGQVGEILVDIHGQSDHLSLLKPRRQRDILDAFGIDHDLLADTERVIRDWKSILTALHERYRNARETAQRIDLLTYQIEEIDKAQLIDGEDRTLEQEYGRLSQIDRLSADVTHALRLLDGDEREVSDGSGALQLMRMAERPLASVCTIDGSAEGIVAQLRDALFALDDVVLALHRYLEILEPDPGRLEFVADRLARIRDLQRKYGATIADVLAFRSQAGSELDELTGEGFDVERLQERAATGEREVRERIGKLSEARKRAAARLTADVQQVIRDLQLGSASFSVAVTPRFAFDGPLTSSLVDEAGADDIEFFFAPNEGEQPKALARIASGGEMARVMLALKTTLASADTIPTYVFDEVDVGVGGRSGFTVGEKLADLARDRQVLAITHLPQVAGFADQHFRIRKIVEAGRTRSEIEQIEGAERIDELAAMFDGEPPSDASRANAVDMLNRIASSRP